MSAVRTTSRPTQTAGPQRPGLPTLPLLLALIARQRLGLFQCLGAGQLLRPQPTSGQIVEVEILRTAPVRKAHLERAAACDGFVLDQADAVARADGKLAISESGA